MWKVVHSKVESASLLEHVEIVHEGKKFTAYAIKVTDQGRPQRSWIVLRRYNQFHEMNVELKRQYPNAPSMPGKNPFKLFTNLDSAFIRKRLTQLNEFLTKALLTPAVKDSDILNAFLQDDPSRTPANAARALEEIAVRHRDALAPVGVAHSHSNNMPVEPDEEKIGLENFNHMMLADMEKKLIDLTQTPMPMDMQDAGARRQQYEGLGLLEAPESKTFMSTSTAFADFSDRTPTQIYDLMTGPSPLNAANLQQLTEALKTLSDERSNLVSPEVVAGLVISLDPT